MAVRPAVVRVAVLIGLVAVAPLAAQTSGAIAGTVRDAVTDRPIALARIAVDEGRQDARTDTAGAYRVREVRSGWHRLRVERIGYGPYRRDSVLVRAGETTTIDVALQPTAITMDEVVVAAAPDPVLDPLVIADVQRVTADEIRRFPVTTLEEAVALSAGAVGESYRGGRLGQQAFIIDGLGVKNGLDASSGPLGLRLPPDILTEAALITNGFSARYGQAISGLINVVTKEGGERWHGRAALETDRPLWGTWDMGLDRLLLAADGPLPAELGIAGVLDVEGRLDADPVNAPPPEDPRDPRSESPALLPHNSGERVDAGLKLRVPLGARNTLRLFGLRSNEQRLLFDPAYKYEPDFAPARRVDGTLLTAHLQRATGTLTADLRFGTFTREFTRGTLVDAPRFLVGAFTGERYRFVGEDLARSQDTAAARAPISGFALPDFTALTPWGVPAFFLGGGSRGEITWNRYRDYRGQLDLTLAAGSSVDVLLGGEIAQQRVRTFQRLLGYLPADSTVPVPTAADFRTTTGAAYLESALRGPDFALTLGVRYDRFHSQVDSGLRSGPRHGISPRFAFSTALRGATVVASWGMFSQAPDLQYLTDAAFDDTLRTGRFRRGNPNLGFETATQYEFSVRGRPSEITSLRINVFQRRLGGLVASVPLGLDPDSTIFGNSDYGTARGAEVIFEREVRQTWGVRIAYTLQQATATATDAYQLVRRIRIDTLTGDTINPARVEFPLDYDRRHALTAILQGRVPDSAGPRWGAVRPLAGLELAVIVRVNSGLPFTRTNATGDTLIGLPNSFRLPGQSSVDFLLRRPISVAGWRGSIYVDVRNLLNRRNIEAVRRDFGTPGPGPALLQALANQAYQAHPEAIPYESPRYRAFADLDGNGLIEGPTELMPLYLAAARDVSQPLFSYGAPRLIRLGVELVL